ncbi:MAG: hypothetical protein EXS05_23980 [Planctomycetaceae bacterium]|nr:hypothetical protein [Planctomycetaceae bacterium]
MHTLLGFAAATDDEFWHNIQLWTGLFFELLLAALAAGVLGYFWLKATIADGRFAKAFGSRPIIVLLTATGTAVLWKWGVNAPGPVHGVCWVLGCLFGVWIPGRSDKVRKYAVIAA